MKDLKKIILKIFFFILALIILSFAYTRFRYQTDLDTYSPILENLKEAETENKILYFGESSNSTYAETDSCRKKISQFTADFFPSLTLEAVDHDNYKTVLENISKNSQVETVIVTMNLRNFDAGWRYSGLETALQKSMVLIDPRFPPIINRIRLSFKDYEIKSQEEWDKKKKIAWKTERLTFPFPFPYNNAEEWNRALAKGFFLLEDGSWDNSKIQLACNFVKNYAFQIDTVKNPRIKDYDEMVSYSQKYGLHLVFNLMAENTQRTQELVGDELVWLMRQNRDLLVKRYNKGNTIVVDNLETLADSCFIDRSWPTEHYNETGRKTIARNLADSLRLIYPDSYVNSK